MIYELKKLVLAKSLKEAVKKEKDYPVHECYVNTTIKMEDIGFKK
jgi:hypothetical protein